VSGLRVVITGVGVISPNGIGKSAFWEGMITGRSGISEITSFDTSGYRTHRGGEIKDFDPSRFVKPSRAETMGRGSQLAIAATQMALADSDVELTHLDPSRIGICLGTTMGESQVLEALNSSWVCDGCQSVDPRLALQYPVDKIPVNTARHFGFRGPVTMITTACAAGNYAIGYALDLLRMGRVDVMVAGGSDPFSRIAFTGFNSMLAVAPEICQPFDRHRKGMMVSEGAAMVVLEPLFRAVQRNAPIYAEVAGCGISNDAHHMTSPHPNGKGAIGAMENAIREAQITPEQIDYINAHGTGTPANDRIETAAIKAVFREFAYKIPVSSIKSMIGHTMGAASAIEAVACALVVSRGIIPPTMNYRSSDPECDLDYVPNEARAQQVNTVLSNSFAFGGNCAALILKKFQD
jgi:3-oxoacyl-[acyl-carrier-protein] synthase II